MELQRYFLYGYYVSHFPVAEESRRCDCGGEILHHTNSDSDHEYWSESADRCESCGRVFSILPQIVDPTRVHIAIEDKQGNPVCIRMVVENDNEIIQTAIRRKIANFEEMNGDW